MSHRFSWRDWNRRYAWLPSLALFLIFSSGISRADEGGTVVIFWASVGNGHRTAAESIQRELEQKHPGIHVVLKDVRDFLSPRMRHFTSRMYDIATQRFPALYNAWFESMMRYKANTPIISDGLLFAGSPYDPQKVLAFIRQHRPIAIGATFNHAAEVLIDLKRVGKLGDIPIFWQHTDYVPTAYFRRIARGVDQAFVGSDTLRDAWIRAGVPPDHVTTAGMPIDRLALTPMRPEVRAEFLRSQGLSASITTVLLTSGSNGVGDYPLMVRKMAEAHQPLQIVAACGRNEENFRALSDPEFQRRLPAGVTVKVLRFQPLLELMRSADVIVGKSGGLTPTEIAAIGKPMILLDINGGQETYNAKFFRAEGMALVTRDQGSVGTLLQNLLDSPETAKRMVASQQEFIHKNSKSESIVQWVYEATVKQMEARATAGHRCPFASLAPH